MMIYFAASTGGLEKYKKNYKQIIEAVESMGYEIAMNWIVAKLRGKKIYKNSEELVRGEVHLLTQCDFMIVETSVPSFGVGYIIRQALTQRKPVLCLYPDNLDRSAASEVFLGNSSNLLKVEFYNSSNLKRILDNYLNHQHLNGLLKFNFLITPEINAYLEWATENTGKSKSEFLREEIINKIIDKDEDYKSKYRKKR